MENNNKIPEYDSTILELIPILPKLSEDKKKELIAYAESLTEDEEEESDIEITKKNISKFICYNIINACFCAIFYTIAFCGPKIMEASHDSFIIEKWAGRASFVLEVFLFAILCLEIYRLHLLKMRRRKKNRK